MDDRRAFLLRQQWYIRKGENVTGPFAGTVIRRWIAVGRLTAGDELSVDQVWWQPVHRYPEFVHRKKTRDTGSAHQREREVAAARWEDERRGVDRRDTIVYGVVPPSGQRSGRERRDNEDPAAIDHRDQRRQRRVKANTTLYSEAALRARQARWLLSVVVGGVAVMVMLALWLIPEPPTFRAPACDALPKPEINWNDCNLGARDLRAAHLDGATLRAARFAQARLDKARLVRADLSYAVAVGANLRAADLRSAILVGADLRLVDLHKANLEGADLRHANLADANLSEANLREAKLTKAIWVDGHLCVSDVGGRCDP